MESRLLTDEDIVFELFFHAKANMSEIDVIKIAQDAKTHRIDCEGLAEWGKQLCVDNDMHQKSASVTRSECSFCQQDFWEAISEGRMPWESKPPLEMVSRIETKQETT